MNISFWLEDKEYMLNLDKQDKNELCVSLGDKKHRVSFEFLGENEILLSIDGKIHLAVFHSNMSSHSVFINGKSFKLEKKSTPQILGNRNIEQKKRDVKTSMPGKIIKVLAQEGDIIQEGQAVLILEAMKMQNEIKSPQSGQLVRIVPRAGETVETGALLFSVD
ncbi:acetyl-CoA carboxylase biotin carboxyl carrier protein subunit [Acidobacteriota bacterium]